jgi:glutamine synthetase
MSVKVVAEYIWLGGNGELRSKARTLFLNDNMKLPHPLPDWNYDGSSTGQAAGEDSEVVIRPCTVYRCPFRKDNNILVMCDTYKPNGEPLTGNNRHWAKEIFDQKLEEKPWYGLEQEYFMIDNDTGKPLGFPIKGHPNPQGQYYCSVGSRNVFGRKIVDMHYEYCLYAGLNISGVNAEVAPGQWEFQIGPVEGINAGDELYIARYILYRIAEEHNITINIEAKPVKGDWNGSGCHANYSTKSMREGINDNGVEKTGYQIIKEAIEKLALKHMEHMKLYGTGNELRMTGKHETANFNEFSYGVANRGASIRIPNTVVKENKGYLEDRRPSSNIDPYLVTGILFKTTVLD